MGGATYRAFSVTRDDTGDDISATINSDRTEIVFVMPDSDVTVKVAFMISILPPPD